MINYQTLRKVGRFIERNAPIILTGLGVVGVVGTTTLAVKESKKENPNYTLTVIAGALTVGCIIGGAVTQAMKTKEIADAFNNLAHRMGNYKTAVDELGAAAIINSVSKMEVDNPDEMEHLTGETAENDRYEEKLHWFWDEYSNTWFKGSWKQVYYANMVLNEEYAKTGYAPIRIYYNCLDLPFADECPDNLGFDYELLVYENDANLVLFDYDDVTAPNGDQAFAITWPIEPKIYLDEDEGEIEDGYLH